jgi:hypothetical protein
LRRRIRQSIDGGSGGAVDSYASIVGAYPWQLWHDAEHRSGTTLTNRGSFASADATITGLGTDITTGTIGGGACLVRAVDGAGHAVTDTTTVTSAQRIFFVGDMSSAGVDDWEAFGWYVGDGYYLTAVSSAFPQGFCQVGTVSGKVFADLRTGLHVICLAINSSHATHKLYVDGVEVSGTTFATQNGNPSGSSTAPWSPMGSASYGAAMSWRMSAAIAYADMSDAQMLAVSAQLMAIEGI